MAHSKAIDKEVILNTYQTHDSDTGSCEVQVALLSSRITHLTAHLRQHPKDVHTRRGLIQLTNRRRKLLKYLKGGKPAALSGACRPLGLAWVRLL